MFGLDQQIASLAGTEPLFAIAVALLLGLRHPLDPDHVAAVGAIGTREGRRGALVGLSWGAGHGITMLAIGLPVVLWSAALPERWQRIVEATIGLVIFTLGLRLLLRHRRGGSHVHPHGPPRCLREAYAVGAAHGLGGSAGVGLLMIGAIPGRGLAVAGLAVFTFTSALAMTAVAAGLGRALNAVPELPVAGSTCAFGVWYLAAALAGAPYPF